MSDWHGLVFRLGALQREASESDDRELANTVRLEGDVYHIFKDGAAFERYQPRLAGLFVSLSFSN